MNTITELQSIVNNGDAAQSSLNEIAEDIYDTYLTEIESQKAEVQKEYPSHFSDDIRWSELEHFCNCGFHHYRISGNELILTGHDYFRGERNQESDSLPISVFIDDKETRDKIIKDFVKKKADTVRGNIELERQEEETRAKQNYEYLKERFKNGQ